MFIKCFVFTILTIVCNTLVAQDESFVSRSGINLVHDSRPFYAIGANCYYLQNLVAYGDTTHLMEVLQQAKSLGINTIRTWGFFDSSDSTNRGVIQFAPGRFNEHGLKALDFVISQAKICSIKLIIPLVNNWDDYGGMNQYVRWYGDYFLSSAEKKNLVSSDIIYGAGGRKYSLQVIGSLTHDDFYRNSVIKSWYKNYVSTIVNRVNTITGISYRDESTILAWELANEPRSSDPSGEIVTVWLEEMSAFLKSIDPNHLISSGEEGLDITPVYYSCRDRYNGQQWMFEGLGGVSYYKNSQIQSIDIASIHCYPEAWGLTSHSVLNWISDHQKIAQSRNKPILIGEIGSRSKPHLLYTAVLNDAYFREIAGVLLWQLIYPERFDNDGYGFSCSNQRAICEVLSDAVNQFRRKQDGLYSPPPATTQILNNYPNPFNTSTLILYDLSSNSNVSLDVYNGNGQYLTSLVNEYQQSGRHVTIFDGLFYSSGMYIIRLKINENSFYKKILLVK